MTVLYRLVVTCDENLTEQCRGLVEYTAPDRLDLARKSDEHTVNSEWLRGWSKKGAYDVCPACRKIMQARARSEMKPAPKETAP